MERIIDNMCQTLSYGGAKYTRSAITDIVRGSISQKRRINEILGLTPDNNYTHIIPINMSEEELRQYYPALVRLVKEKAPEGEFSLRENKIKVKGGETKLTRFLNKVEIPDHILAELQCSKVEDFLPRLGEVGNRAERELFITTNPHEFIRATHNCSYSSCFRYGGEWFCSTIALSLDRFTVLTGHRKVEPGEAYPYKLGRAWLYVMPDEPLVMHQKTYGEFSNPLRKQVRRYVENKIDVVNPIDLPWKVRHDASCEYCSDNDVYFDNCMSVAHKMGFSDTYVIHFNSARCLVCGDYGIGENETCTCDDCGDSREQCYDCGRRIDSEDVRWIDGTAYCDNCVSCCDDCQEYSRSTTELHLYDGQWTTVCCGCAEEYVYCDDCDRYMYRDDSITVGDDNICPRCINKYHQCEKCGDYIDRNADTYEVENNTYCANCVEHMVAMGNLFYCEDCCEYVSEAEEHKGRMLCDSCHPGYDDEDDEQYEEAI